MLVVDAWFDVLTSRRGADQLMALALAVVEIGLAVVCVWIAFHAVSVVRTEIADLLRRAENAERSCANATCRARCW